MANAKISHLPPATVPLAGTETVPLVQGGVTKQAPASAFGGGGGGGGGNTGIINVLDITGIVNDGVTDCQSGFNTLRFGYANHGSDFPVSGVTITIANPAVFTLAGHGFGVLDPVVFSTTGVLPTGITA